MSQSVYTASDRCEAEFCSCVVEQYRIMSESCVAVQTIRNANNKFMLSISIALLALPFAFVKHYMANGADSSHTVFNALAVFGCLLLAAMVSVKWKRMNEAYHIRIRYKYMVLNEMEERLPARPFARVNELKRDEGFPRVSAQHTEIAGLFLLADVVSIIGLSYWLICG